MGTLQDPPPGLPPDTSTLAKHLDNLYPVPTVDVGDLASEEKRLSLAYRCGQRDVVNLILDRLAKGG